MNREQGKVDKKEEKWRVKGVKSYILHSGLYQIVHAVCSLPFHWLADGCLPTG